MINNYGSRCLAPSPSQDFLTGFDYAELVAGVDPDVAFGLYDTYQAPRDVRLTVKLEF